MAIKILTDSSSEFSLEDAKKLDITVMQLGIEFFDNYKTKKFNINTDEFYRQISTSTKLPKTVQIKTSSFEYIFKKCLKKDDQILGIFISSKLSATFQNAVIQKNILQNDNIYLIDSKNTSVGLQSLVRKAVQLKNEGKNINEIVNVLEKLKKEIVSLATVEELDFLSKGGRISMSSEFLGNILSISPILTCAKGRITTLKKVTTKSIYKELLKIVYLEADIKKGPIILGHCSNIKVFEEIKEEIISQYGKTNLIETRIGPTVGTHIGPTGIGISFFKNNTL